MDNTMAEAYYLKARDNYPYEMSVVVENLEYALNYDDDHPGANALMGRVLKDQRRFSEAEYYLEKAIQSDVANLDAFYHLTDLMITVCRYSEAYRIIEYALRIAGADRLLLLKYRARALESQGQFHKAIEGLSEAVEYSFTCEDLELIRSEIRRIRKKRKFVTSRKVHLAHP